MSIDWTYDAWNRLTQEVRDEDLASVTGNEDTNDSLVHYVLDPAGNRLLKQVDLNNDGSGTAFDQTIRSVFDANDRLSGSPARRLAVSRFPTHDAGLLIRA